MKFLSSSDSLDFSVGRFKADRVRSHLSFVLAQVVGRKHAAVFGFENYSDAAKVRLIYKREEL